MHHYKPDTSMLYTTMLKQRSLDKTIGKVEDSVSMLMFGQTIRFSDVPFLNEKVKSVATFLILIIL